MDNNKVLVLRTNDRDNKGYNGFQWPKSGRVDAPDWVDDKECGHGLHGWLWGEGDGSLINGDEKRLWVVCEVDKLDIVDLSGKVKFPSCSVVYCGDCSGAFDLIISKNPGAAVVFGTASAGNRGTARAGDGGTASAGDWGTASAGYWGTASAGDRGTASAGYGGTASAGYGGIILITYYQDRSRVKTGYIGEGGLVANVSYKLDNYYNFVISD